MGEWGTATVGDFFELIAGYAFKSKEFKDTGVPVIKIKNVKAGEFSKHDFSYVDARCLSERKNKVAQKDDLLISMSGNRHDGSPETWVGKVCRFNEDAPYLINQRVGALRLKKHRPADLRFFGFLLSGMPYQERFIAIATSSGGQANLSPSQILGAPVRYPDVMNQRRIGELLGTLDDKIELNRQMNETLEAMARAIFKDWFVDFGPTRAKVEGRAPYLAPELWDLFPATLDDEDKPFGWKSKPLDEIAEFLNGLALQKYPASGHEDSLPVIKIAELRAGVTAKTNRASREVPERYVVKDRDFLFSWSGSLVAKFWTDGEGALNQHLFKVSSDRYPAWFFSHWIHHHLEEFQAIAASKATTMGHIQRRHLKDAIATCPPDGVLSVLSHTISPLVELTVENELEIRTLARTRDLLLPKLMSGEIRLAEAEKGLEAVA